MVHPCRVLDELCVPWSLVERAAAVSETTLVQRSERCCHRFRGNPDAVGWWHYRSPVEELCPLGGSARAFPGLHKSSDFWAASQASLPSAADGEISQVGCGEHPACRVSF